MPDDTEKTKSDSGSSQGQLADSLSLLSEAFTRSQQKTDHPVVIEFFESNPDIAKRLHGVLSNLVDDGATQDSPPPDHDATRTQDSEDLDRTTIGDYEIVRKIGQGGMGVVYEAQQTSLGRRVALKMLPSHISNNKKYIERFKREARAAAKLHHTNIVPVYEVGQDGDSIYYAMQFIHGRGLDQIKKEIIQLTKDGSTSSDSSISRILSGSEAATSDSSTAKKLDYYKSIAKIGASVADAMNYAHERSIIHRDVKPSNLILDTDGVIWLADFGLAKTTESELTETGDFLGTARYMSPERLKGLGDHRGDIYALGVTLYELITLAHPFGSRDRVELLHQIANADPRRPRDLKSDIPLDLETIILKAMDKDPRRRYQSAAELSDDLRRFVDDQSIHARRASPIERTIRWMRRNKALTTAIVSMFVAIVVLITGTITTLQQRNLALKNEKVARDESQRADQAANKARQSAVVTVDALTDLVDSVQTEMINYPELVSLKKKILLNAESKLQRVSELNDDSPQSLALKTTALDLMGKINYEIGDYPKSKRYYEEALELTNLFAAEFTDANQPDERYFRSRAAILTGLGNMAFKQHNQSESRSFYKQALENNQAWNTAFPKVLAATVSVAAAADNLADTYVLLNDRDWDTAESYHLIAYQSRQALRLQGAKTVTLDYDLATSNLKLGDMHYGRVHDPDLKLTDDQLKEELAKARKWFVKAKEDFEQVVNDYPEEDIRGLRSLASAHERIADVSTGDEAQAEYLKALEIRERMAPKLLLDRNFQRDLAVNFGRMGMYYGKEEKFDTALEYMNKCRVILQETLKRIPDDHGLKIDVMVTYAQIANLSIGDDKRKALEKGKAIGDQLIDEGVIPADHVLYKQVVDMLEQSPSPQQGNSNEPDETLEQKK